jgi:hypothetical protein
MRTSCNYGRVLKSQIEEQAVGVRRPPACKDVSPETEECPLLEGVTSRAVMTLTEKTSLCVIMICKV